MSKFLEFSLKITLQSVEDTGQHCISGRINSRDDLWVQVKHGIAANLFADMVK